LANSRNQTNARLQRQRWMSDRANWSTASPVQYHSLRGYEARRGLCEDDAWLEIMALKGPPACSLSQRKPWPCVAAAGELRARRGTCYARTRTPVEHFGSPDESADGATKRLRDGAKDSHGHRFVIQGLQEPREASGSGGLGLRGIVLATRCGNGSRLLSRGRRVMARTIGCLWTPCFGWRAVAGFARDVRSVDVGVSALLAPGHARAWSRILDALCDDSGARRDRNRLRAAGADGG
jgi:hypothetical protein